MKRSTVVKIGGDLAKNSDLLEQLCVDLQEHQRGGRCLLVHGGGGEVTDLTRRLGMEPLFENGVRITTPQEMTVVENVLSGKINKRLVRIFQQTGINAVGLCGSDGRLFIGHPVGEHIRTGEITEVQTRLLEVLMRNGYFPIISSTSMDGHGGGLNINADSVGFTVACAIRARNLVFFSNIPGILKDRRVLPCLSVREAEMEIENGTITEGMIPKVQASIRALQKGISNIFIGSYEGRGSLSDLLTGKTGTRISS
jgi:acetylglutamate kinase